MSAGGALVVTALVVVGMVVVLPLGLRLLGAPTVPAPRSVAWPLAGLAGAVSLALPRGPAAVVLASAFAAATAVLLVAAVRVAVAAVRRPARSRRWAGLGADCATAVALATPAVGASALVAERAGWGLLGFSGTYLALTVPHMLYAGFGAALVAGTVAHLAPDDAGAVVGAWGVPVGTLLVLVGYFVGDAAELVGALVLTAALWATAFATVRSLAAVPAPAASPAGTAAPGPAPDPTGRSGWGGPHRAPRALVGGGAVVVALSMLLAVWWAAGEALDLPHPSLDVMAATHGVANALGFVLCSLLGLRLLVRDRATDHPAPDGADTRRTR
ncbi:YndJ family transporter [Cellulosimicrobium sp. PMB13]|uniref:YndJ family transporter n=1 Tax=Cellulosimicrobium sp. PMB13 TaxID=3120158 RepID=UPI003F4C368D